MIYNANLYSKPRASLNAHKMPKMKNFKGMMCGKWNKTSMSKDRAQLVVWKTLLKRALFDVKMYKDEMESFYYVLIGLMLYKTIYKK